MAHDSPTDPPPVFHDRIRPIILQKLILIALDAMALDVSFFLSYNLRNIWFGWRGGIYVANVNHVIAFGLLLLLLLSLFRHAQLYQQLGFKPSAGHLEALTVNWLKFSALFIVFIFLFRVQLFSEHRITTGLFVCIGWLGLYLGRFHFAPRLTRHLLGRAGISSRTLLVGGEPALAERVTHILSERPYKAVLAGYVSDPNQDESAPEGLPCLGELKEISTLVLQENISDVYISLKSDQLEDIFPLLEQIAQSGIHIRVAIHHFEVIRKKIPLLTELDGGFLAFNISPFVWFDRTCKRILDFFGALSALAILSPLFLWTAIKIKLSSPGPVFFRQDRTGLDGKPFRIFKFRTMRENTESHHAAYVEKLMKEGACPAEGSPELLKSVDASMVTPIGDLLRRSSLDELPQLINVLMGDMSLVGPRPEPVYQTRLYEPWKHGRHSAKPGLTGFWQAYGRSSVSHEDMVLMDLFYIYNWSFALDLRILFHTVFVVLTGTGAI